MLSLKTFQEVFMDLASLTHGTESMPDVWTQLTPEKLEQMGVALSPEGQYIDWRAFLLQASHPWPVPTQTDLLETLDTFHQMDQKRTGTVTREQFDNVTTTEITITVLYTFRFKWMPVLSLLYL